MDARKTIFKDWINKKGVTELAKILDVQVSTVRYWRMGHSVPRPPLMLVIKKLSKGRVTYDDMINWHLEQRQVSNAQR